MNIKVKTKKLLFHGNSTIIISLIYNVYNIIPTTYNYTPRENYLFVYLNNILQYCFIKYVVIL